VGPDPASQLVPFADILVLLRILDDSGVPCLVCRSMLPSWLCKLYWTSNINNHLSEV
jgi:hypothetical protein